MVNRGKEKVRVHMNVVPRSTINTNGEAKLIFSFTVCVDSAKRHNIHMQLRSEKTKLRSKKQN